MLLTILAATLAAALPGSILFPSDIEQAQGVVVAPFAPHEGVMLQAKDPDRPSLWSMPAATQVNGDVVTIWYQRVDNGEPEYADKRTFCMGELRGDEWSLPSISPEAPAWGGPNNVVMRRSPHKPTWGGFNVFQMVMRPNEYTLLYWDQPGESGDAGVMVATSSDGRAWNKEDGTVFTEHNDAYSILPVGDEYIMYQTMLEDWPDKPYPDNLAQWRRVQAIRTSKDLRAWTPQEILLRPDEQDPPETEFYLMKAFPYGAGYLGLIMKYFADPAMPNKHSAILKYEFAISRDGRAWERPYRDVDVGFWSYADPFTVDGQTNFAIWGEGMRTVWYEAGRIVGARADAKGSFVTKPLQLTGPVAIDADASGGTLIVTVVDENGTAKEGFAEVDLSGQNGHALAADWSTRPEGPVRLRIEMEKAVVYGLGSK